MPYYLTTWVDSLRQPGFKEPAGVANIQNMNAIDLSTPGTTDGFCLLWTDIEIVDARVRQLAVGKKERLTASAKNHLRGRLKVPEMGGGDNLDDIIAWLMFNPPSGGWNPLRAGRRQYEIWLGGLLWSMPLISGGTSISDDFDRADNDDVSASAPFTWTEVAGDFDILSNEVTAPVAQNIQCALRAETNLATDVHKAQADIRAETDFDSFGGVAVRFASGTHSLYRCGFIPGNNIDSIQRIDPNASIATQAHTIGTESRLVLGEADGSTISVTVEGASKMNVTDTTHAGSDHQRTGLACFSPLTPNRAWFFDNFAAADAFVPYPNPRYALTGGMQPMGAGV